MTTLIQRAAQLAYADSHESYDRIQRLANMVNNKIAIEHRDWREGDVQTHVAVALLSNCSYTQDYLIEEMGERVANAVIAIQEGVAKTNPVAAFVQKVISLDDYLSAVAKGEFNKANEAWSTVEGLL